MTPWLLRIAYDGTDFAGCPEALDRRTVAGTLREALARIDSEPTALEVLSRTDAGVHAQGNIAIVHLSRDTTPSQLLTNLDRHLPPDLRCTAVAATPEPLIIGPKRYRYTVDLSRRGDPLAARIAWRPSASVDPRLLEPLAEALLGVHSFEAFRRQGETRADMTRQIRLARWTVEPERAVFTIEGGGFPYKLVRSLVGGMIAVGAGACPPGAWTDALTGQPTHASRQTAPAKGLTLLSIDLDAGWVT
jgi:tRNA pseudouridine38-40 synthase